MTFMILKDDTKNIACQSKVHPGNGLLASNLRFCPATMPDIIKFRQQTFVEDDTVPTTTSNIPDDDSYQDIAPMPIIETSGLM